MDSLIWALIVFAGTLAAVAAGAFLRGSAIRFGDNAQIGALNTGRRATTSGDGRLSTGAIAAFEDAAANLIAAGRALRDARAFVRAVRENRYAGTMDEAWAEIEGLLTEAGWKNRAAWLIVVVGRAGRYPARGANWGALQGGRGFDGAARAGVDWTLWTYMDELSSPDVARNAPG